MNDKTFLKLQSVIRDEIPRLITQRKIVKTAEDYRDKCQKNLNEAEASLARQVSDEENKFETLVELIDLCNLQFYSHANSKILSDDFQFFPVQEDVQTWNELAKDIIDTSIARRESKTNETENLRRK